MKRGTKPIKKVNAKRRASEFERCFHSDARVKFVQSLPCLGCGGRGTTRSLNAHTKGDGAGRRATYTTIIPLCFTCHGMQHAAGWSALPRLAIAETRDTAAAATERDWLAYQARTA